MIKCGLDDTIVAISTPLGQSGIGIVRLSGKETLTIVDKIFVSKDGRAPSDFKTYTIHYGWIIDSAQRTAHSAQRRRPAECIDEVILTVMRAPRSYTKEDVVEINCHSGIVTLRRILDLVLDNGGRLAEPGEFTKRAFLNGRIDLAQAEAVLDIIKAKTESSLKIGVEQLRGFLSQKINLIRNKVLDMLSRLETNIDFPEEEISPLQSKEILSNLESINKALQDILATARHGRIYREGINIVICGKPNVGKSSLLNALLKQERSIVSPIPGTTRDTIEEIIDIKGIPAKVVDTAGIIEPGDLVERKAVQRSKRCVDLADLVILLFDGSKKLSKEDIFLIRKLNKKNKLAIINKIDLRQNIEKDLLLERFGEVLEISAKKFWNMNLLEDAIANLVYNGKVSALESILVSNLRHIEALRKTQKIIAETIGSLDNNLLPIEFLAQNLKDSLLHLDEILGRRFSEDLLDKIFSEFCIGK